MCSDLTNRLTTCQFNAIHNHVEVYHVGGIVWRCNIWDGCGGVRELCGGVLCGLNPRCARGYSKI